MKNLIDMYIYKLYLGFNNQLKSRWEMRQESVNTLKARRDAVLRELADVVPFVAGSLAEVNVKCGKASCRCAADPESRHKALILCKKVRGKSTSLHVPLELAEEVRKWSAEHKRVKRLMKEVSDLGERIIRLHVRTERAAGRNRAAAERISPAKTSPD